MRQAEDRYKMLYRRGVLAVLAGSAGVVAWIVYPAIHAEMVPDGISLNSHDVPVVPYPAWTLWDWLRVVVLPMVVLVGGLLLTWCTQMQAAQGRQRDWAAVHAGVTLPWHNGITEGHVNRIKLLKRQGYRRAGFTFLRQRVLHTKSNQTMIHHK